MLIQRGGERVGGGGDRERERESERESAYLRNSDIQYIACDKL